MKIDVEGMELDVINGASQVLTKIDRMAIEIEPATSIPIKTLLEDNKFKVDIIGPILYAEKIK